MGGCGSHRINISISSAVFKITTIKNIITKTKMISMNEFSITSNKIIKRLNVKRNAFKKYNMTINMKFSLSRIIKMIGFMDILVTEKNIYDITRRKLISFYLWTKIKASKILINFS